MSFEEIISEIIKNNFSKNDYFDSHSIINELISSKKYFQCYLENFSKGNSVAQYHGLIAQQIEKTGLAEKVITDNKEILLKTHTIYGELSQNHLWKRV